LEPDEFVGVIDLALAIEAGPVPAMLPIHGMGFPKREHILEEGIFVKLGELLAGEGHDIFQVLRLKVALEKGDFFIENIIHHDRVLYEGHHAD
jgi:hypothetical protein